LRDRNVGVGSKQRRDRIGRQILQAGAVDFFNLLTGPELLEMTEEHLPEHRERLYPPTVAFSMFIKQSLALDRSCQRAVDAWAGQRAAEGLSTQSIRTGGYCRARARLPLEMIVALTRETGRLLSTRVPRNWGWRGRCVKLADGTGISMPDTQQNRARYPQPRSQAPGVGFPLAGLVGIVCLSTGAVLEAAIGAHESKGQSEQDLFRDLHATLCAGDVLLADALYCSYFQIATLQAGGVDVLFEQHGARITDFRRGQPLGKRDHLVRWSKPHTRPQWLSLEQYRAFPDEILVREAQVNGQVLVSTMHNARAVSKGELAALYAPLAY
jgi:Transposase DDE domain